MKKIFNMPLILCGLVIAVIMLWLYMGVFIKAVSQPKLQTYAEKVIVKRVIDGDTIAVTTSKGKSERVRLIGIDTPESQPNDKAKRDAERTGQDVETITKMGAQAKEFLSKWATVGQPVHLVIDVQERDKYGRLLAYVFRQIHGLDKSAPPRPNTIYYVAEREYFLNATIIKAGYATPMTIPPNVKYAELFKELYEEAREQKRGLWR